HTRAEQRNRQPLPHYLASECHQCAAANPRNGNIVGLTYVMIAVRKWVILIHRYLGITVSLLFVMWFVSGIAMIFARGMPSLTPGERLKRLPELDISAVKLTPLEAAAKAELGRPPFQAVLLMVMGRPAYRFAGDGIVTVFA